MAAPKAVDAIVTDRPSGWQAGSSGGGCGNTPIRTSFGGGAPANRSPNQFHRKLDLPRWRLSRCNKPCVGHGVSRRIEYVSVVQGRGKIRMIHNVEKLGPELRVEAIRDALDVVVLEQREIEVHQSGYDECVPAQISAQCNGIGDRETLRLDVADGITRIHRRTATRTGNQVRNVDVWVGALHSERVSSNTRGERHASASFEHSSDLPSSQRPRFASRRPLRRADFPGVVDLQILRNVKVRESPIQSRIEKKWTGD